MPTEPSRTRRPFLIFAASRFLIREPALEELRRAVERLRKRNPEVEAVYLFGSYASGTPTPRSDVDLLVVANEAGAADLRSEFLTVPVPVDLHLTTPAAFRSLAAAGKGLPGAVVREGVRLL